MGGNSFSGGGFPPPLGAAENALVPPRVGADKTAGADEAALVIDHRNNALVKQPGGNGLGQVFGHAGIQRLIDVTGFVEGGDHDHRGL